MIAMRTKRVNGKQFGVVALLVMMLLTVTSVRAASYNIYIAGTTVTDANKGDLSVISGVTGTVSYDSGTNTLTLTDATIEWAGGSTSGAIDVQQANLKVVVNGSCSVTNTGGPAFRNTAATSLLGSGSLSLQGSTSGMHVYSGTLTIDGPNVTARGQSTQGVTGRIASVRPSVTYAGNLVVNSGRLRAYGETGSIMSLNSLTLGEGVQITIPEAATISGGNVRTTDGVVKQQWVVIEGSLTEAELLATPITFEAAEAATVTVVNTLGVEVGYAVDGGEVAWQTSRVTIDLEAGQTVSFYGNNTSYYMFNNGGTDQRVGLSCDAPCFLYGNIMSLVQSAGFENSREISGLRAFMRLFRYSKIKNHPLRQIMLPATKLNYECYEDMFYNCTLLEKAPALPATRLADYCYASMFNGCTSLTEAPELPATTLGNGCYVAMFADCTALAEAPDLPAMTLTEDCYRGMFSCCTSLTEAPQLPATKLERWSYQRMFEKCENLSSVKCMAKDISAVACTSDWLSNVSATGTFTKFSGFMDWTTGGSGIPEGWTVNEEGGLASPELAFSADALSMTYGEDYTLPTLSNPHGLPVVYQSSNPQVASVDAATGALTPLMPGTTVISAVFAGDDTYYAASPSYTLTVVGADETPVLAFSRQAAILDLGKTVRLPQLHVSEGLNVYYTSSASTIASVNAANGTITANGVGQTVVTVRTDGNMQYTAAEARFYVTVLPEADALRARCDVNADGSVTVADAVTVVEQIVSGAAE